VHCTHPKIVTHRSQAAVVVVAILVDVGAVLPADVVNGVVMVALLVTVLLLVTVESLASSTTWVIV
jgi:hypothetical protein